MTPCSPTQWPEILTTAISGNWLREPIFLHGAQLVPASLVEVEENELGDSDSGWSISPGMIQWFHGAQVVPASTRADVDIQPFLMRFISHMLVDRIADDGMSEVCQSLGDLYEYYKPVEPVALQIPDYREHEAKLLGQMIRPQFSIEGE